MSDRTRLNYLRAFDAAARNLSFSAAAVEMNLTQAAISQQIAKLERSLGAKLFIRHNRALSLSEQGRAYHLVVREVLDRLDAVTERVFPALNRKTVAIRCTPSVASLWLAPRLAGFQRLHPGIDVRIQTLDLYSDRIGHRQGDLAIYRAPADHLTDADTRLLWTAEIFPVCSPAYLAGKGPIRTAGDIAQCDLIDILGYANNWHRWLHRFTAGRAAPSPAITVDGLNMAVEAACRGEGVILGRTPLIDPFLEDRRLIPVLGEGFSLRATYYLAVSPGTARRAAARLFADWIARSAGPR